MKFKALKSFDSAIGSFEEGTVYDYQLDDYTFQNWVEVGLIEEVKEPVKKSVKTDENK